MPTPQDVLSLAHWRRTVTELYATVRRTAPADPHQAWRTFRAARDGLFRGHPQSPLAPAGREAFATLDYYPYAADWCLSGALDRDVERRTFMIELSSDGPVQLTRVAKVRFAAKEQPLVLNLYWIEGYGGGLFLPIADATNGRETYGGGRYLYDTIKGADLGLTDTEIVLDFNYAYNPSCAYDPRWDCPLPPAENRLPLAIRAGERLSN
jgi:uncharacterized protein